MTSLKRSLMLALTLPALLILTSCGTTHTNDSSVIAEVAAQERADTCADLALPILDLEEFNTAPQYWRDLVLEMDAAWMARCG